ncbi:MAG: DUF559 domain-containing protein [Nitrospira sp.]|nr:DUF559 domain-containing protein [Nitrospira sp.]
MAGEWQRHEVSQLLDAGILAIGDGYRAKNEELAASGVPFARAGNIKDGFHFDDADHFPEEHLFRVGNKVSQPGDVVFTSKGTVGRFAFVHDETPRFVYSPQLCFWRTLDRNVIEPRYLFYWMFGNEFYVQFKGVASQTDMAEYVSLADQRRMHVTLPPPVEQRAIAHILGTLDDEIELNRRMSETLEATARALFQSWFIDFDPVRRNAGRARNQPSPPAPLPRGEGREHYRGGYDLAGLVDTARALRKKQTHAEAIFWEMVRDRRLLGLKFRRQHQLGDYVADFYCHEHRLVIEFDGGVHSEKKRKDHKRDAWMKAQGIRVLRFPNKQLLNEPESILSTIAQVVEATAKTLPLAEGRGAGISPSPSGRRAGDEGVVESAAFDHLFPARLVDSELGEIPEGWEVGTIGDMADVSSGKRPTARTTESYLQASVPLWGGNGPMGFVPEPLTNEPILLTGRVGTLGSVFRITTPCWPSDNTLVVRANQPPAFEYLFFQLRQIDYASLNRGSTQPLLTQTDLKSQPVILPISEVLEHFSHFAGTAYRRIDNIAGESRALAAIRDALLPKLISGELRVKDAERFLKERGL